MYSSTVDRERTENREQRTVIVMLNNNELVACKVGNAHLIIIVSEQDAHTPVSQNYLKLLYQGIECVFITVLNYSEN